MQRPSQCLNISVCIVSCEHFAFTFIHFRNHFGDAVLALQEKEYLKNSLPPSPCFINLSRPDRHGTYITHLFDPDRHGTLINFSFKLTHHIDTKCLALDSNFLPVCARRGGFATSPLSQIIRSLTHQHNSQLTLSDKPHLK